MQSSKRVKKHLQWKTLSSFEANNSIWNCLPSQRSHQRRAEMYRSSLFLRLPLSANLHIYACCGRQPARPKVIALAFLFYVPHVK